MGDGNQLGIEVSGSHMRCPFCHDDVDLSLEWVACASCLARHHAECWGEGGGCGACRHDDHLVKPDDGDDAAPFPSAQQSAPQANSKETVQATQAETQDPESEDLEQLHRFERLLLRAPAVSAFVSSLLVFGISLARAEFDTFATGPALAQGFLAGGLLAALVTLLIFLASGSRNRSRLTASLIFSLFSSSFGLVLGSCLSIFLSSLLEMAFG